MSIITSVQTVDYLGCLRDTVWQNIVVSCYTTTTTVGVQIITGQATILWKQLSYTS